MKYACPCCNMLTLEEEPPGTYEICPVCGWEDDEIQFNHPEYCCGANNISLEQAKNNFKDIGAINRDTIEFTRDPLSSEIPY